MSLRNRTNKSTASSIHKVCSYRKRKRKKSVIYREKGAPNYISKIINTKEIYKCAAEKSTSIHIHNIYLKKKTKKKRIHRIIYYTYILREYKFYK